jgi:hypothetical protein
MDNGCLKTAQAKVDWLNGSLGSNADCAGNPGGVDLQHALDPCTVGAAGNLQCRASHSGLAAACGLGEPSRCSTRQIWMGGAGAVCDPGFQNLCDGEWIGSGIGNVPATDISTPNFRYGIAAIPPDVCTDFLPSYMGTFLFDVPAGAKGTYSIGWVVAETFLRDNSQPVDFAIPISALVPALITIECGSCCFGIGGPAPGCTDSLSAAECAALAPVAQFDGGGVCDNPPTDDGCCACLVASDCNDGDACTTDTCSSCVCSNNPRADWDPTNECCDSGSGAITTLGCPPGSQCGAASCTLPGSHGSAQCLATPGAPCDDDNPCTYGDTCGAAVDECAGSPVNSEPCLDSADCAAVTGIGYPCEAGFCKCTVNPDLDIEIVDLGGDNCFAEGEKVAGSVRIGASSSPVNGGQVLLSYDPTCLEFNSIVGGPDFPQTVYGPVVDEDAGTIFFAVGVEFGMGNGPSGNTDLMLFSFNKIGECNSCNICPLNNNPQNTYLTDHEGQRITVVPNCSKDIFAESELDLIVPGNIKTNVDCDQPYAVETWDAPSATDSCGTATVVCRGSHESGLVYDSSTVNGGGEFPIGASSFCCYATSDGDCPSTVGCPPDTTCADADGNGKPDGCWTVTVNDETSLDILVGLSPEGGKVPPGTTRCIKFTLYSNCIQEPLEFCDDVTFGGLFDFVGKSKGKIKVPGSGQWDCITAQDKLHTLRSCFTFDPDGEDCVDGQLQSRFSGDPRLGGNWLIGGNLDGWKKCEDPITASLDVIDILDFGTFVAQYLHNYGSADTLCGGQFKPECCPDEANADINGDGIADMDDYSFVSANFLVSSKNCCCGPQTASASGVTEISVAQLRAQGQADLAVADLNGDGLLNLADMASFDQGVRPTTKGGKGGSRSSGSR